MDDPRADEKDYIHAILDYMRHANRMDFNREGLRTLMDAQIKLHFDLPLGRLLDQLRYNEGIFCNDPQLGQDLRPDLDRESKRMLILMALEDLLENEHAAPSIHFFEPSKCKVEFEGVFYDAEALCMHRSGFEIYRIPAEKFYLLEMDFAYYQVSWTDLVRIMPGHVATILAHPEVSIANNVFHASMKK